MEDSPVDMELVSAILAGMDRNVVADNGTGAWNIINTGKPPNLILLDLVLPGFNGFQLLEHIRSKRRWKNVTVLIVSGDSHPATASATWRRWMLPDFWLAFRAGKGEKRIEQISPAAERRPGI